MPAVFIYVKGAFMDNAILLEYLTSNVAVTKPEIGCTHITVMVNSQFRDDKLYIWMAGDSGDFENDGDTIKELNAFPTPSLRRLTITEHESFYMGNGDIQGY
jgi:hypothetical protein